MLKLDVVVVVVGVGCFFFECIIFEFVFELVVGIF